MENKNELLIQHKDVMDRLRIYKRTDMIQKSRGTLNKREQKAISYILTKVSSEDPPGKEYVFSAREFAFALDIKSKAKYNYENILSMLQSLADKSQWIANDKGGHDLIRWFNTVHTEKDARIAPGTVKITFHQDVYPYINNLMEQFRIAKEKGQEFFWTSYSIGNTIPMKCKYSPRLYEILVSYNNNSEWWFNIKDLQELLADLNYEKSEKGTPVVPASWKNFAEFRRTVLDPAVKEINEFTEMELGYDALKTDINGITYRSVQRVIFFIHEKNLEAKKQVANRIIEELDSAGFIHEYETVNEQRTSFEEKEQFNHILEMIDNSRTMTPLECEYYDRFSKEQISALRKAALLNMPSAMEEEEDRYIERWICDYVKICETFIAASSTATKTNDFDRLLNEVIMDHHKCAAKIKKGMYLD